MTSWSRSFFRITAPLARGIQWSPVDSPHKKPAMRTFYVSFDVNLNKLLSKQLGGGDLCRHEAHVASLK